MITLPMEVGRTKKTLPPPRSAGIRNSPISRMKTNKHPVATPGMDSGSVTLRKYGVETFGWYLDREHVVYTPTARDSAGRMEMRVVNFRTGKEDVLLEEPHTELIVAQDGTAVAYCRAASHFAMQLYYLKLRPPSTESVDGLPTPEGQPVQLTDGNYHVHNGGWSPDGKEIVYTRVIDEGNINVIEPR